MIVKLEKKNVLVIEIKQDPNIQPNVTQKKEM